jgi:hypothetical protein
MRDYTEWPMKVNQSVYTQWLIIEAILLQKSLYHFKFTLIKQFDDGAI